MATEGRGDLGQRMLFLFQSLLSKTLVSTTPSAVSISLCVLCVFVGTQLGLLLSMDRV
jgi:hypothetical protein